jgi:hypothetical protein
MANGHGLSSAAFIISASTTTGSSTTASTAAVDSMADLDMLSIWYRNPSLPLLQWHELRFDSDGIGKDLV